MIRAWSRSRTGCKICSSRGVVWVQTIMDGGASDDLPLFMLSLAVLTWAAGL